MANFRPARVDDGPRLAEIDHACWSPMTDPRSHWSPGRPFFGVPTGTLVDEVLVAAEGDEVLGFIKIRREPSDFGQWYVAGLGVAPVARRQGLARKLIHAALTAVEARGGDSVWLRVLSSNVGAVALYSALGFAEVARFADAFEDRPGVDDLRLSAQLPLAGA